MTASTTATKENEMETANAVDKAASPAPDTGHQKPEPAKKRKRANPTQGLLRAKKKLDEAMEHLAPYPELSTEAGNLRSKVLHRFVEEEERAVARS